MTVLALVRHGRTALNRERRLQGRSDVPLDEVGREQARGAAELLRVSRWDRIVCSPLERAVETARIVDSVVSAPAFELTDALLERDFGEAEGMLVVDAERRWKSGAYPGGETWEQVGARAELAIVGLMRREGATVAVSHGMFIRAGVEAITGAPCPRILNGQVVFVRAGEHGRWTAEIVEPAVAAS